jgi:hypothetical protein
MATVIQREDLLQFIWQTRLLEKHALTTYDGQAVRVLHPGTLNENAGPDFLDARVRIGDTIWAGHVEIHIKTGQWLTHKHHLDRAYNNVVLHVVFEHDGTELGIPVLELKEYITPEWISVFERMMQTADWIPCSRHIGDVQEQVVIPWLTRMAIERMEEKSMRIESNLQRSKGNWEETVWQTLARGMGGLVNRVAMEELAVIVPLRQLRKIKHDRIAVEGILLGAAGFLQANFRELIPNQMQNEFRHYKQLFGTIEMEATRWKFGRMRPAGFPTIRISQLAGVATANESLVDLLLHSDLQMLRKGLKSEASAFWREHYLLHRPATNHAVTLGDAQFNHLMVNVVVPLRIAYGRIEDIPDSITDALELLEQLPAEEHKIVKKWQSLGLQSKHAADSQGLLHLYTAYCTHKQCLRCRIGYSLLHKLHYI